MGIDLKGLARRGDAASHADEERGRDGAFRRRVSMQQFMNHNGPLFRALAFSGAAVGDVVEGPALRGPILDAARLASLVASRLTGKEAGAVTASDMAPFRSEAAAYVAAHWAQGTRPDLERAAAELAAAAAHADASWDHDAFRDGGIGAEASMAMTAAGIAGTLARAVELYDFRAGRAEALGRMVRCVAESASDAAREMLPADASASDLRNVTQTLARNLSSLMEACYERRAREVVVALAGRTPEEKARWFAANDPLGEVVASFREWALCLGGFAVAASREMSPPRPRGQGARDRGSEYRD